MNDVKVYLVGAGPGDIDLITVKGKKLIEEADCIIYDRLINPKLLDFARKDCELIYLGKENTEGGESQELINKTLVDCSKKYKKVIRLKGGDPFVFGRGGEEIEYLNQNNIKFEIVPGITSAISVPAYAGIPVTHRNISRSFHIFTGHTTKDGKWHNFEIISKLEGTLIFLMSIKNLERIVNDLIFYGKDKKTPVAIIENGATKKQRTTTGILSNIVEIARQKGIKSPAIIIIGENVLLREKFKWFEESSIINKNILITRDKNVANDMAENLQLFGAKTKLLPLIDIEFKNFEIEKIDKYKAILFNSANGVRAFLNNFKNIDFIKNKKIGAVGEKTKEVLEENNIKVDFFPEKYLVDELAKETTNFTTENDDILIITSNISPCDTEKYKKIYNRNFEKVELYNTNKIIYDKDIIIENLKDIDMIIFLSSSAVDAFYESLRKDISLVKDIKIISIGPSTSKTLKNYGFSIYKEAKKYSLDGIYDLFKGE